MANQVLKSRHQKYDLIHISDVLFLGKDENMSKFIMAYLNDKNIKNVPALQPGSDSALSYNAIILSWLLALSAAWCDEHSAPKNMNIAYLDNISSKFKNMFDVTDRTVDDSSRELINKGIIKKIKTKIYYINPFLFAKGNPDIIRIFRTFCVNNDLFYPTKFHLMNNLNDENIRQEALLANELLNPGKEWHTLIYCSFDNIQKHISFYNRTQKNFQKPLDKTKNMVYTKNIPTKPIQTIG